ncbi:PAAR domain-containing protein [Actinoplanes sp. RD1]|uniref:PAAR domain-containing protein n=1 Tax=Actinoplanes sp. RD1 TaxID=3064538 RepID=UPI002740DEE3|nr:PAAR domain-containing protein [Actinoplanes sp. RD1]
MPHLPAAKIGDPISQTANPLMPTGTVGTPPALAMIAAPPVPTRNPTLGISNVRINGRPAAVVGTLVTCAIDGAAIQPNPLLPPIPPRIGGQVLIGGFPAARMGDKATCLAVIVPSPADAALPRKVLIGG